MILPEMPGRNAQRRVLDVLGLLAEDDLEQALLGGQLLLALRRDLSDEDVALADDGGRDHDAGLVEGLERLGADVRDVARDLFRSELGVASLDLELGDVDRREDVFFDELLRKQDGVLEVVAFPRHEADEKVAAERELALVAGGTVGEHVAAP